MIRESLQLIHSAPLMTFLERNCIVSNARVYFLMMFSTHIPMSNGGCSGRTLLRSRFFLFRPIFRIGRQLICFSGLHVGGPRTPRFGSALMGQSQQEVRELQLSSPWGLVSVTLERHADQWECIRALNCRLRGYDLDWISFAAFRESGQSVSCI